MDMWPVLIKSLLFVAILALLFGAHALRKRQLPFWLATLRKSSPSTPREDIQIRQRKLIAPQQSLMEIEWRGTAYLLHVGAGVATVLDRKTADCAQ